MAPGSQITTGDLTAKAFGAFGGVARSNRAWDCRPPTVVERRAWEAPTQPNEEKKSDAVVASEKLRLQSNKDQSLQALQDICR